MPATPALPVATRSGVLALPHGGIWFAQFGQGPSVLLLHGGLGHSAYWAHQIRALAPHFTVTVMDTRGHGRSPMPAGGFGYRAFAEDAFALLDRLGIGRTAVAGWSDGGITGLRMAMARPARIDRLFAFGANATPSGVTAAGSRTPIFRAYVARCRAEYAAIAPRPEAWGRLVAGLSAMWRNEPDFSAAALAGIAAPTRIADGEHDEIIRRDHTEAMARAVGMRNALILPGVSHFAMLQDPETFSRALLNFLRA